MPALRPPRRLILQGLALPALALMLSLIVGSTAGMGWGYLVLAVAWTAILVFHLGNVDRLATWALADTGVEMPDGRGVWAEAFSALARRTRTHRARERDLASTIARFRSAAEAIPDGMIVLDAGNRIKWANCHAQTMLGLDMERDVGAPLIHLVRNPQLVSYLEAGEYPDATIIESPRSSDLTLAVQSVPFGIDEKLLTCRDITQLEAVARMRRDFIANVSHELKTPLTVISGFVETLQELKLDDRQRERFLQLMQEQSRSMQRLVEDLLTLSALESEQNALTDDLFPIIPLVNQLAADAKGLSHRQHQVAVRFEADAMILGSRDELASAFGNLVSNAIRYTPSGGTITLTWTVEDDGTGVFAVGDTGIGIAAEHIPRLTERFYRVDRSRSRSTGGTGLGLAIVKHVLLRHQAELGIVSELERGSTFSVRLPSRRVQRQSKADTGEPDSAATSSELAS